MVGGSSKNGIDQQLCLNSEIHEKESREIGRMPSGCVNQMSCIYPISIICPQPGDDLKEVSCFEQDWI